MSEQPTKRPPFHPLTNREWVQACQELKPAELKVLFYLKTLDPFCQKELELQVVDIGEAIGLHKSTVSRALKILCDRAYIALDLVAVRIKLLLKPSEFTPTGESFLQETEVSYTQPEFPTGNQSFLQETEVSYRKPEFPTGNDRTSEPAPGKGFRTPKNLKNKKEFKDLSLTTHPPREEEAEIDNEVECEETGDEKNSERSVFFSKDRKLQAGYRDWLRQKALNLPETPRDLDLWIGRQAYKPHIQQAYQEFLDGTQAEKFRRAAPPEPSKLELQLDQALLQGDRQFVRERLAALLAEGWNQCVEEICKLRRDWGFRVRSGQLVDERG